MAISAVEKTQDLFKTICIASKGVTNFSKKPLLQKRVEDPFKYL